MLAGIGDHAVAAEHDARRRLQRHPARIFETFARRDDRLLADDARATNLLHPPDPVGDVPVAGLELYGLAAVVGDFDGVGPEELAFFWRRAVRHEARRNAHLNIARHRAIGVRSWFR